MSYCFVLGAQGLEIALVRRTARDLPYKYWCLRRILSQSPRRHLRSAVALEGMFLQDRTRISDARQW